MDIVAWIGLCLFACIGAVELFGRIFYGARPPKRIRKDYFVVPLENDSAKMKAQIEYYLNFLQWNGPGRPILFVHNGMDDERLELYDLLTGTMPFMFLCRIDELEGMFFGRHQPD